jgi:hypothetical protein
VTIPTGGTVTVTVVVQATAQAVHEHGDTEPAGGVTNLGSTTATAPGTATVQVTPSLSKTGGEHDDRGGRHDELHDRDRQRRARAH